MNKILVIIILFFAGVAQANSFYNATGAPAQGSSLSSSTLRAEYGLVEDGFDKFPTLTGNGDEFLKINAGESAIVSVPNADVAEDIGAQPIADMDASGGYVGKTNHYINFKNLLGTYTSYFANSATAVRTYTFPDKSITVAGTDDVDALETSLTLTISTEIGEVESRTITAGSGLTGGGALSGSVTLAHADTSSQADVNNSGATVIQDVGVDAYGHVDSLASVTVAAASHTHSYLPLTGGTISSSIFSDDSGRIVGFSGGDMYFGQSSSGTDTVTIEAESTINLNGALNGVSVYGNYFYPLYDNDTTNGKSANRWSVIYAANGTIQTSDENLKHIIGGIDASFIYALDPIRYRWREKDNGIHFGFPARKTAKLVDPETYLVQEDEIYSIAYDELIAPMVKCIQDQKEEIEDLKSRLVKLEKIVVQ